MSLRCKGLPRVKDNKVTENAKTVPRRRVNSRWQKVTIDVAFRFFWRLLLPVKHEAERQCRKREGPRKEVISIEHTVTTINFNREILKPICQSSTPLQSMKLKCWRGKRYENLYNVTAVGQWLKSRCPVWINIIADFILDFVHNHMIQSRSTWPDGATIFYARLVVDL